MESVEDVAEAANAFFDFGDRVVGETEAQAVAEVADAGAAALRSQTYSFRPLEGNKRVERE
ncbi:MAG: hypothetical protein OXF86_10190 [Caldilineaceae bacterium]|nr:hypothetical protein [Caldilineaceae bacterium]